jgi:hypothetical protein
MRQANLELHMQRLDIIQYQAIIHATYDLSLFLWGWRFTQTTDIGSGLASKREKNAA